MIEQNIDHYTDSNSYESLLNILKQISGKDSELCLSVITDLVDDNKFIWIDEFGRVKTLVQEDAVAIYELLKNHQRMLNSKEFDFPRWQKYQNDLESVDHDDSVEGFVHLTLRVWIKKEELIKRKNSEKSKTTERAEMIIAWVQKHKTKEKIIEMGKLKAWNTIFTVEDPALFPSTPYLGENCKVSKAFSAADIKFKPGRPALKQG